MPLLLQGTHKIFKGKFYVESLPEFVCVCVWSLDVCLLKCRCSCLHKSITFSNTSPLTYIGF